MASERATMAPTTMTGSQTTNEIDRARSAPSRRPAPITMAGYSTNHRAHHGLRRYPEAAASIAAETCCGASVLT